MRIRSYRPGDASATLRVFERAIGETALSHYSPEQVAAWLGGRRNLAEWDADRRRVHTFVAEAHRSAGSGTAELGGAGSGSAPAEGADAGGGVVGFADVDDHGYVDRLFVSPDAARRGIAGALLARVEAEARARGIQELTTHASLVARPVFERAGFAVVEREIVTRGGVELARFRMRRPL